MTAKAAVELSPRALAELLADGDKERAGVWRKALMRAIEAGTLAAREELGHPRGVRLPRGVAGFVRDSGPAKQVMTRQFWLSPAAVASWLTAINETPPAMLRAWLGTIAPAVASATESPPARGQAQDGSAGTWKEQARKIADECFDRDTANNCRDSLTGYASRVMDEMQKRGIHGPRGRITNPNTIQRDALQGAKWWASKTP